MTLDLEVDLMLRELDRRTQDCQRAMAGDERAARRMAAERPVCEIVKDLADRWLAPDDRAAYLSVFGVTYVPPAPPVPVTTGWSCPDHGYGLVETVTSREGRTYRICMDDECDSFEDGE